MADEILTTLQKVRKLFKSPKRWTQGVFARDKKGEMVSAQNGNWNAPSAYAFCIRGGIHHVLGTQLEDRKYFPPLHASEEWLGKFVPNRDVGLAGYNNNHSYEEMMAVLDKAIEARKGGV